MDRNGAKARLKNFPLMAIGGAWFVYASIVAAAPEGGRIVAGTGAIDQSTSNTTVIEQRSNRLAIDWQRFNIAPHERVSFRQPSSSAAALNRIFDQNPSQILGRLDANGRVLLLNPNGLVFGPHAQVNVNGLLAAAGHMEVERFMAGQERLLLDSGEVLNAGELNAAPGGAVNLLGRRVENSGLIVAQAGRINLVGGERLVVDFEGDGLLRYAVADGPLAQQLNSNEAAILMSPGAAETLRSEVVNSGTVRAGAVDRRGGAIRLIAAGGDVFNRGSLDASGYRGGEITVAGNRVALLDHSVIDVSGQLGGGLVSIGTGDGQPDSAARRLYVAPEARIQADAGQIGNGGTVRLWSQELTDFGGHISARGGALGGDGGLVEVSARRGLRYRGSVGVTAANGSAGMLLLDPRRIVIIEDMMGGRDDLIGNPDDGNGEILAFTEDPDDLVELSVSAVTDQLKQGANVVLQAHDDIEVQTAINVFGQPGALGADLTLEAGDDLVIDGAIVMYQGNLNLIAGSLNATPVHPDGSADVVINAPINTTGGAFSIETNGAITTTALVDTKSAIDGGSAGAITIRTAGDQLIGLGGGLVAVGRDSAFSPGGNGGDVIIESIGGGIVNGSIDTRAGNGTAAGTAGKVTLTSGAAMTVDSINAGDAEILVTVDPSASRSVALTVGGDITGMLVMRGGGDANDTLVGPDQDNRWEIDAPNGGFLNDASFSDFADLRGGAQSDRFVFAETGSLSGDIDGGHGDDALDYGERSNAINIDLAKFSTTDLGGAFTGIESAYGSSSSNDQITGTNAGDTWLVDGSNSGSVAGIKFNAVEHLAGGNEADRFVIADGGSVSTVDGGGDSDTLDYSSRGSAVSVDLDTPSGTGVGSFTSIEFLQGSTNGDTLAGTSSADEFDVDGNNRGAVNGVQFESFERLDGAAGNDLFKLNGDMAGGVNGGADADTFLVGADMTSVVAGGTGNDSFVLAGGSAPLLDGESGSDTLQGADASTTYALSASGEGSAGGQTFQSLEKLIAGKGNDSFIIANGASFADLKGGEGEDNLDFSNWTSGIEIDLGNASASGVAEFSAIETVFGTAQTDSLIGTGGSDVFTVTERDAGTVNGLKFVSFERLDGGSGADQFLLNAAISDRVGGGSGSDRFDIGALAPLIDGGNGTDIAVLRGDINASHAVSFTDIEQFDTSQSHLIAVPRLSISGASAGLGTAAAPIKLNTAALDWAANGNSYINNRSTLTLERVEVGGNLFALTLQQGSLSQAAGTSIDAGKLVLDLPGGLGSRALPLRTTASALDISTKGTGSGGDIFIDASMSDLRDVTIKTAPSVQTVVLNSDAPLLRIAAKFTGNDHLEIGAAALSLNGILDSNGGFLTLDGPLAVRGNSSLLTRGGSLLVRNAVSGPGSLTVISGAGNAQFVDSIGSVLALQSLAITAGGIDIGAAATTGAQRYNGSMRIAGNLTASEFQLGGTVQLLTDVAMTSSSNTFGFGAALSGPGNLALVSGQRGTITVAASAGIGRAPAAAFSNYSGHLVIGSTLDPLASPGREASVVDITTDRVIIDTPLILPGELTILASNIDINADVGVGATRALNLIAVGDSQGFGTGPGNITGPAQGVAVFTGASALLVANNDILRASNIRLDLNGGPALVAVASQQSTPSFNLASNISSSKFNPQDIPLLASLAVPLNIQPVQLVLSNPAQLVAVQGTPFVDIGVFETELSLVNVLGGGLALDVFQCEDAEICAASMDIAALDNAISQIRARMQQLQTKLQSGEGDPAELEILLETYQEQLRVYEAHRRDRSAEQGSQQAQTRATRLQLPAHGPNLSAAWAGL
jgi:filamentous hemagglutinin family protein